MSRVFLTADLHLGHKNVHKFRGLASAEEHDALVKENYLSTVTKRDSVIFLGDICFSKEAWEDFFTWPGIKTLYLGNHDTAHGVDLSYFFKGFNKVHSLGKKNGCWLSHMPIHPDELRGKPCVHGHTHNHVIDDPRYRNVCLEHTEYKPMPFNTVIQEFKDKQLL